MTSTPQRVLSPSGRFIIWNGRMHKFYIKNGMMCLPPYLRVCRHRNGNLALYSVKEMG